MPLADDFLTIAGRAFSSRLFIGTGKYSSHNIMKACLEASRAEMVTVALRRVDITDSKDILSYIDQEKYILLPNTSGARDAGDAVRIARLAKACGAPDWIKLEVTPDPRYLLPDGTETLKAAETLVKEGFKVLAYINADPILAKRLAETGVSAVMPLGAPIGSNKGVETKEMVRIIIEQAEIPVVVDAGLGAPSHAALAMEMGASAVLVNTAIACASDPVKMAEAFRLAVEAGRAAYTAGLAPKKATASASGPLTGFLADGQQR